MTISYTKFNAHNYSVMTFDAGWKWNTFYSVRSLFIYQLFRLQELHPEKEYSLIVDFRVCADSIPTNTNKTTDMIAIGDFIPSPSVPSFIVRETDIVNGLSGLFVVSENKKYERVIKSMFMPSFEWDELTFYNNINIAKQVLSECVIIKSRKNDILEKVSA